MGWWHRDSGFNCRSRRCCKARTRRRIGIYTEDQMNCKRKRARRRMRTRLRGRVLPPGAAILKLHQQLATPPASISELVIVDKNANGTAFVLSDHQRTCLWARWLSIDHLRSRPMRCGSLRHTCRRHGVECCLLYTSPSPRDRQKSRMPSSA